MRSSRNVQDNIVGHTFGRNDTGEGGEGERALEVACACLCTHSRSWDTRLAEST